MMADMHSFLIEKLKSINSDITAQKIELKDIVFEERMKLLCFHCACYNSTFTCPPKIPEINYKKMIEDEYENALAVYCVFDVDEQTHKALLKLEKILWDNNFPTAVAFIGGGCKLCKDGCGKEKCNNPYAARISMEATGINVVKTYKHIGVDIIFPPQNTLGRYGLIVW
jgi:predicted metal-binding protein